MSQAIRARIQATLQGVGTLGIIHPYERYAKAWDRFLALLTDPATQTIRAATITRESGTGQRVAPSGADRYPVYVVRLYWALNDANASEVAFDEAVEAAQTALAQDVRLGGLADLVDEPKLRRQEPRMYGAVLVHYAEIALTVHETKEYTLQI
jgi:hypothetical protein